MKNVYKVTYDIRLKGKWLGNVNGFDSRTVIANGDAREAANKVEKDALAYDYDGVKATKVRILEVVRIAHDVLE